MKLKLEAHDLLWGMTVDCLADDAPHWVKEVLQRGDPVVVRRAITPVDQVAVGVEGNFVINDMQLKCHDQRLADSSSQKR